MSTPHTLPQALAPLVALPNWVIWRWQTQKGKRTKVPYQPKHPHSKAKNNDPSTWSDYATAVAASNHADGIGFCLLGTDIAAFDIDDCRDPQTGAIDPWAQSQIEKAGSYTEVTISGTGLRIIGLGVGPKVHRKQPVANGTTIETYRKAERYIVMTGAQLGDRTLVNIDAVIDETVTELDEKKKKKTASKAKEKTNGQQHATAANKTVDNDDDELWRTVRDGGGDRHGSSRSEAVWFVVNEMLKRGFAEKKIIAVLLDRGNGISEHICDQANPEDYAERQVTEAISQIDFARDENGVPIKNAGNTCIALLKLGVRLTYDEFADRTLVRGLQLIPLTRITTSIKHSKK